MVAVRPTIFMDNEMVQSGFEYIGNDTSSNMSSLKNPVAKHLCSDHTPVIHKPVRSLN